jgi:hypothetical protein
VRSQYWPSAQRIVILASLGWAMVSVSTPPASAQGFSVQAPRPGFAAIYIGRPFGGNTSIFSLPIELDGRPLVSLGPNNYTRVEVRPGRHVIAVPDNAWTVAISGKPHPAAVAAQAGKSYYLLPKSWAGQQRVNIVVIGSVVAPTITADSHSSFSVQSGGPPKDFTGLSYTAPAAR